MISTRGRWLSRLAAASLAAALLAGCAGPDRPAGALWPFGPGARDAALRKQAEADPFPSAQQVGLQQQHDLTRP
jgi:hypothetical protein